MGRGPAPQGHGAEGPLGRGRSGGRRPDAPGRAAVSGSLTDIAGLRVGHCRDREALSGVTAIVFDTPTVAAVDIRGGGPPSRGRPTSSIPSARCRGSMRLVCPAVLGLRWMPPPASRPGSPEPAAASRSARRGCRSCRRRSCSTSSTAATRRGAATRPIATSASRRPPRPAPIRWRWARSGRARGAHRQPQGGLGQRLGRGRGHGRPRRGARGGERARGGSRSGTGRISGRPVRGGRRVRGNWAPADHPGRRLRLADEADARRQHDDRGGGDRCPPDQGRGRAASP